MASHRTPLGIIGFLLLTFFTNDILAQRRITSAVTDKNNGDPMIGVSVVLKSDPGAGTLTDIDGAYLLDLSGAEAALIFRFVSYKELEVAVGDNATLDVSMEEDAQQLGEVVVTALGIKRQKRELGYSTESFSGEELVLSNQYHRHFESGSKSEP